MIRLLTLAAFAALPLAARPAAQTYYFPANATINSPVGGDAFVGYDTAYNPSSPTVNLVRGGLVDGGLETYNASTLNIRGGSVSDIVWAMNSSTVTITDGAVGGFLEADNASAANISGGTFGQYEGVNFLDNTTGAFTFYGTGLS